MLIGRYVGGLKLDKIVTLTRGARFTMAVFVANSVFVWFDLMIITSWLNMAYSTEGQHG
ncbi:MAG: hypothetical protein PCFJNLEI_00695 [Verrucomicrobiae bacterium]|nr:hypothetical protein [Verrucomicrobiae bacterium]